MRKSPASLAERLPAFIPDFLRKPLVPLSYVGASFILGKYSVDGASEEQLLGHMDEFLAKAETALKNREFVFDTFSFADITIATMLQAVTPVDFKYIDLGEASAKIMREPVLEEKYAALIAWRDGIYARYR
jgi:glutathione S-transferase